MMSRKRMIDPNIWTDEGFLELSPLARLLFIGLISHADDEGRGGAGTKSLKARIFSGDDVTFEQVDALKREVETHIRVTFYTVDGTEYYQLAKWNDYQVVNRPRPSTIPLPEDSVNDHGVFTTNGMEGNGRERNGSSKHSKRQKQPSPKKEYAKGVTFTDSEYENMCVKHGKGVVDAAAEILSAYKEAHGKEYKSDAGALREWALGEAVKRGAKRGIGPPALDIRKCPKGHEYLAGTTCRVCGWKEGEGDS